MLRLHYLSLVLFNLLAWLGLVHASPAPITRAPALLRRAQPTKAGIPGTFEEVGTTGASAQQLFLGSANKIYVIDKVENNAMQVAGHPVWATEYNVETNNIRGMDVRTNTFCAGGNVMGNGTWINVGGNKAVTFGGLDAAPGTNGPYNGISGGSSVRFLDPCNDDDNCEWRDDPATQMTSLRWYPTLETLEDGRVIIIGGNQNGGYVNDNITDDNPTYEYWPPEAEGAVEMQILLNSRPINLYPLTWLLPSGNLFIQAGYRAEIFDYKNKVETFIPDVPTAVRCYPASAASVMLPLVPSNNYDATLLFCGGNDLKDDQWKPADWAIINYPTSPSCVKITPDASTVWETDDDLPQGRTMGNFIILPDGKLFLVNGAKTGTAGYGNETWVNGHSYADGPLLTPLIFDPAAPAGSRWSSAGLSASTIPRLYHSTATLLPDGSVFIAGSNPNPDVQLDVQYPTDYRAERFYPSYYSSPRPEPIGLPSVLGYGGEWFDVSIDLSTLGIDLTVTPDIKIIVMRFGFSTHAINFGQRYLQLNSTFAIDGNFATVHTSQMPPNAALFAPGPAWISAVVNGVPAVFSPVMIGNGILGPQDILTAAALPELTAAAPPPSSSSKPKGAATALVVSTSTMTFAAAALGAVLLAVAQL